MRNLLHSYRTLLGMLLLLSLTFGACKRQYDEPPYATDPDIQATTTIAELQAMYTGTPVEITDSLIIVGVVTGNDQEDNLYKKITLQDATAGIEIEIDQSSLYASYPVGRRLFINLKGLTLGTYNGLLELGLGVNSSNQPQRISSSVIDDFITVGSTGNVVEPVEVTISELSSTYQSMLVSIKDVEFADSYLSSTYADSVNSTTANVTLQDCSANTLSVRTSGYASFANKTVAQGKGTITGIYSFYNSDKQFYIRTLDDVADMTGVRCDGTTASDSVEQISIDSLRSLYSSADITVPRGRYITGYVISNSAKGNVNTQNLYLQEGNDMSGILVRFTEAHSFTQGQKLKIAIGGQTLTSYYGQLELNNIPLDSATATGDTMSITPKVLTITELKAQAAALSGTLVTISTVTLSNTAGSTYSGTVVVTDATGTVNSFVRTGASFASSTFPTAASSYTGVLNINSSSYEVNIRDTTDVIRSTSSSSGGSDSGSGGSDSGSDDGSGSGSTTTVVYTENFSKGGKTGYADAASTQDVGSWQFSQSLVAVSSTSTAKDVFTSGNTNTARLRGANSSTDDGYIMMNFDLTGVQTIAIDHAGASYDTGDAVTYGFTLFASYDAGATWTQVGSPISSTVSVMNTETFTIGAAAGTAVRFKILNTSSNGSSARVRMNIGRVVFTTLQ
ncbi:MULTISPECIES: DUF5689 domain-containing protein [unclassified Chitinophaga]|uniref:DUF5689 domain-containing protein n=1 Tax=unclassified Chitinophaga TaxID=2619133 RepID=UPI0009C77C21|nr:MULTISPECIES: DUF5689 domain-containing protein [unclassified Chitinophaga]OMP78997.1 hypothetical protein BW716_11585 [[Flexibacter] sp. ATCC 35208]WPV70236.1 DUF5689 domain-containing protein [Chitinophaga sp. LS1]